MGPQHRIRIYVSFDSPFIIRFLEPWTNYVFKASSEDYHFDENIFPSLEKEKLVLKHDKKLLGIIQSYLILIQGQINVNLKFKR